MENYKTFLLFNGNPQFRRSIKRDPQIIRRGVINGGPHISKSLKEKRKEADKTHVAAETASSLHGVDGGFELSVVLRLLLRKRHAAEPTKPKEEKEMNLDRRIGDEMETGRSDLDCGPRGGEARGRG